MMRRVYAYGHNDVARPYVSCDRRRQVYAYTCTG